MQIHAASVQALNTCATDCLHTVRYCSTHTQTHKDKYTIYVYMHAAGIGRCKKKEDTKKHQGKQ